MIVSLKSQEHPIDLEKDRSGHFTPIVVTCLRMDAISGDKSDSKMIKKKLYVLLTEPP